MGISFKSDVDNQTKLFTALGYGEKATSAPFLDGAIAGAYSHGTDNISLNEKGQILIRSEVDGKAKEPTVLDFSQATMSLPKSEAYSITSNPATRPENIQLDLGADIFGSGVSFHVKDNGKVIDGACKTNQGITDCNETIKDEAGNVLLKGHTVTDLTKNPADFHRTTDYISPQNVVVGQVLQHVKFDKAANTVQAETTVQRAVK